MRLFSSALLSAAAVAATFALPTGPAAAASAIQKECAAKYQAAKAANTLNGLTYNQYYKQCAAEAKAGGATPAAPAPATPAPAPTAAPASATPAPAPATTAAVPSAPVAPAAAGAAVFPTAISPEFSKMTGHAARMKTCAQQWEKNKSAGTTGGMKWNPKGGGYYSECNKRLKG